MRKPKSAGVSNFWSKEGIPLIIKEAPFQKQIMDLAELCGWLVYHTHDSRRSQKGFPDLVLVKGGVLLFRELKREKGRATPEQLVWIRELQEAGESAKIWRPRDWKEIEMTLTGRKE